MAENWPWESMHNSQSGSSQQSSQEATAVVEQQQQRPSLVETLQTCLATTSSSLSGPSGDSASRQQSRAIGSTSIGGVVMKRRLRATKRPPTTVVEVTSTEFKETVHRLTGIAPPTPAPVRPQPKRAGQINFVRPVPQVPQPVPSQAPSSPAPPAFWPHFDSFIKSQPQLGAPIRTTASSSTMSWWDAGFQESSHSMMSPSTTTTTTTSPFNVSTSSEAYIDPDLFSDDWFQQGSDFTH